MLATGQPKLDEMLAGVLRAYWFVSDIKVDLREHLIRKVEMEMPDILVVHENLISNRETKQEKEQEWLEIFEHIRSRYPQIRLVFITSRSESDPFLMNLINLGIYDLFVGSSLKNDILVAQLQTEPSYSNIARIKNYILHAKKNKMPSKKEMESSVDVHLDIGDELDINDDEYVEYVEYDEEVEGTEQKLLKQLNQLRKKKYNVVTHYRTFASKVIAISSIKGGIGKTELSLNLAAALTDNTTSLRIVVLDFDFPYGAIAQALGITRDAHIGDWVRTERGLVLSEEGVRSRVIKHQGIHFVPMPIHLKDSLEFKQLQAEVMIDNLRNYYDIILVDTSGYSPPGLVAISRATEVILVTSHDRVSISNVFAYRQDLINQKGVDADKFSLFLNMSPEVEDIPKEKIAAMFEDGEVYTPIIGYAPYDDVVRQYRNKCQFIYRAKPYHSFSKGIDMALKSFDILPKEKAKEKEEAGNGWLNKILNKG